MPLARDDAPKTAFVIPGALYHYVRVPFGLRNAPAHFMRCVDDLLNELGKDTSRGFVDDLLTGGDNFEDYLQN